MLFVVFYFPLVAFIGFNITLDVDVFSSSVKSLTGGLLMALAD